MSQMHGTLGLHNHLQRCNSHRLPNSTERKPTVQEAIGLRIR
jgi:hypothetical protein